MQIKAAQVEHFLKNPSSQVRFFLVYGPDAGLVRERGGDLVKRLQGERADPLSLVELSSSDISADPLRLVDEAYSLSMFGGTRVIRVSAKASSTLINALGTLFKQPPEDAYVVLETGELRKGAALRNLFEKEAYAAAIPCYLDQGQDLARLIDEEFRTAGKCITNEAKYALMAYMGADRMISRSEIQKLLLFAARKQEIAIEDVIAVLSDASAFEMDALVDAVCVAPLEQVESDFEHFLRSGLPIGGLGTMLERHFLMLFKLKAMVEEGACAQEAVGKIRPPVFFRRKPHVLKALELWDTPKIERALFEISNTIVATRQNPALASSLLFRLFITLYETRRVLCLSTKQ